MGLAADRRRRVQQPGEVDRADRLAQLRADRAREVLDKRLAPGSVFDLELPLAQAAEAYAAMDERRSIKTLLRP